MAANGGSGLKRRATTKAAKPRERTPRKTVDKSTREAILEAALEAFARDGFDGASLPKIAELAQIGHPLIHYHFRYKENLWRETVEYAFGGLLAEAATIEVASRSLSPLDQLRVTIQSFTQFAARYPSHFALIMAETRANSERLTWLRKNYTDVFNGYLKRILEAAIKQKLIKKVTIDHLYFIVMGAMVLYFSLNSTLPRNADMGSLADQHAKWVTEVILDGIAI